MHWLKLWRYCSAGAPDALPPLHGVGLDNDLPQHHACRQQPSSDSVLQAVFQATETAAPSAAAGAGVSMCTRAAEASKSRAGSTLLLSLLCPPATQCRVSMWFEGLSRSAAGGRTKGEDVGFVADAWVLCGSVLRVRKGQQHLWRRPGARALLQQQPSAEIPHGKDNGRGSRTADTSAAAAAAAAAAGSTVLGMASSVLASARLGQAQD